MACTFIESDVRTMELPERTFDAGVYLYGQCEVARPDDLVATLGRVRRALRPGAPLGVEARVASAIVRTTGTAWHTGVDGLFGPGVQLVLTERGWDPEAGAGFPAVEFHPGWDGLDFDDAADWLVAIAR